jgi:hypothetical protein
MEWRHSIDYSSIVRDPSASAQQKKHYFAPARLLCSVEGIFIVAATIIWISTALTPATKLQNKDCQKQGFIFHSFLCWIRQKYHF